MNFTIEDDKMAPSCSILVADDEETFRESTCRLLRREGYDCHGVSDGDEAVEKLRHEHFDLLIADIRMPRNPKLRLVREAERLARGMPVILVTGYPSLDTALPSIDLPVAAYLKKPIEFSDLLSRVRPAVERSRRHRTLSTVRDRLRQCIRDLEATPCRGEVAGADAVDAASDVSMATIRELAACLSELLQERASSIGSVTPPILCGLLDCPQQPAHRDAVRETIEVLKRTKSTFKSKELAGLRARLEGLLSNPEEFFCRR